MEQYLTPMGPTKLHVNPIFEISPLEPRFSEWLVFEGLSVDEHGRQHFLDASVAYKRAVLNCIHYLAKFGYTKQQVGFVLVHCCNSMVAFVTFISLVVSFAFVQVLCCCSSLASVHRHGSMLLSLHSFCCQLSQCAGLVHASAVLLQLAALKLQYCPDIAMGLKAVLNVIGLQAMNSLISLQTQTEPDRDAVTVPDCALRSQSSCTCLMLMLHCGNDDYAMC